MRVQRPITIQLYTSSFETVLHCTRVDWNSRAMVFHDLHTSASTISGVCMGFPCGFSYTQLQISDSAQRRFNFAPKYLPINSPRSEIFNPIFKQKNWTQFSDKSHKKTVFRQAKFFWGNEHIKQKLPRPFPFMTLLLTITSVDISSNNSVFSDS